MAEINFGTIIEDIVGRIDDPIVLGWTVVGVTLVWRSPDLIRAIGEVARLGRLNKVEVARKQALLKEDVRIKITRRRSHEARRE